MSLTRFAGYDAQGFDALRRLNLAVGGQVQVNGRTYRGLGTVRHILTEWPDHGAPHHRWKTDQPLPQIIVATTPKKVVHFNGNDLAQGKLVAIGLAAAPAMPPAVAAPAVPPIPAPPMPPAKGSSGIGVHIKAQEKELHEWLDEVILTHQATATKKSLRDWFSGLDGVEALFESFGDDDVSYRMVEATDHSKVDLLFQAESYLLTLTFASNGTRSVNWATRS